MLGKPSEKYNMPEKCEAEEQEVGFIGQRLPNLEVIFFPCRGKIIKERFPCSVMLKRIEAKISVIVIISD